MSEFTQEEINLTREEAKKKIEKQLAFDRLVENPDFDLVITKGFFEEEAIRLVFAKAEPAMQDPEFQKAILRDIDSIGSLRQYLIALRREGFMALKAMEDAQEAENELNAQGEE